MDERRKNNSIRDNPRRGGEYRARSVDEAVLKGLRELGLSRDEVEVEVIKPGSRGLLGLLGEEAVVRVTARSTPAAHALPEQEEATAQRIMETSPRPAGDLLTVSLQQGAAPAALEQSLAQAPATAAEDVARFGVETLQDLLDRMGLSAHVTREEVPAEGAAEPAAVLLNISGPDLGVLIGRQGETLRDLQFVTSLIVSRRTERWPNLIVDVEHYKSRRQKSLVDLAKRMADRVRISGQPVSLEPMPPHERRFVHLALRDDPDVFTESTGQDEKRKVVIMPRE
jgi:spoIIIJ-associated protein